jgi:hypothetical protein
MEAESLPKNSSEENKKSNFSIKKPLVNLAIPANLLEIRNYDSER